MEQTPSAAQVGTVVTLKELSNEKFVIGKILRGGMGEVYQPIPVAPTGSVLALKTYQQTAPRAGGQEVSSATPQRRDL
jgi:hypothetical protein